MQAINISSKAIGQATKWSFVTEVGTKLLTPVTNAILARILVPEAFGFVATINMVVSFTEVFTDAGFQKYIIQHEFDSEDDQDLTINVAFWSNLLLSLVILLFIII